MNASLKQIRNVFDEMRRELDFFAFQVESEWPGEDASIFREQRDILEYPVVRDEIFFETLFYPAKTGEVISRVFLRLEKRLRNSQDPYLAARADHLGDLRRWFLRIPRDSREGAAASSRAEDPNETLHAADRRAFREETEAPEAERRLNFLVCHGDGTAQAACREG
jgi:phosphoenolpyruvate-protein kinase (PTS system EI component)